MLSPSSVLGVGHPLMAAAVCKLTPPLFSLSLIAKSGPASLAIGVGQPVACAANCSVIARPLPGLHRPAFTASFVRIRLACRFSIWTS